MTPQKDKSQIMMTPDAKPDYTDLEGIKALGKEYDIIRKGAADVRKVLYSVRKALEEETKEIIAGYKKAVENLREKAEYALSEWLYETIGPKIDAVIDMYNRKLEALDYLTKKITEIKDKYKGKEEALRAIEDIKEELGTNLYLALKEGIKAMRTYEELITFLNKSKEEIERELVGALDDIINASINTVGPVFDYIPALLNGLYLERTSEDITRQMKKVEETIERESNKLENYAKSRLEELVKDLKDREHKYKIVSDSFNKQGNTVIATTLDSKLRELTETRKYLESLLR